MRRVAFCLLFCCLNRHSARVGRQAFLFFGYILFCAFPVIGCASPLAAVLSDRAAPLVEVLSVRASPLATVLSVRAAPLSNIFSDGASQQNVWWKVESREFVFSIRKSIRKSIGKSIGKSIRKSDSTTRSVRPILWTQAVADAVHMYTSTAFSIYPPICTHCTSKSQPPYNHRTIYHAIIAQISHAQCADKMQALCKHRTLNLSPKRKHRAISHAQSVAKAQAPYNHRTILPCNYCASIARSMCRQNASTAQVSHAQSVAKAQTPCKQHPFCRLFCAFPCRICLSIQVLALGVAKTAKFYRFFTAIGFDAAGASPPVLS